MPTQQDVSGHYTHGNLVAAIRGGIESLGKTINSITVDDLAPVDEFHIGGRQASEDCRSLVNSTSHHNPVCLDDAFRGKADTSRTQQAKCPLMTRS